jgi:hypothetical protein
VSLAANGGFSTPGKITAGAGIGTRMRGLQLWGESLHERRAGHKTRTLGYAIGSEAGQPLATADLTSHGLAQDEYPVSLTLISATCESDVGSQSVTAFTSLATKTKLDLSGVANGTTKNIKLFLAARF